MIGQHGLFVLHWCAQRRNIVVGRTLIKGLILGRPQLIVKPALAHIAHNADDLPHRLRIRLPFAIFFRSDPPRENTSGQRFIDEDDLLASKLIVFGEKPPADQPRLQCRQDSSADIALVHLVVLTVKWLSNDSDPVGVAVALHGQIAGDAYGLNAGQGSKPLLNFRDTMRPAVRLDRLFGGAPLAPWPDA